MQSLRHFSWNNYFKASTAAAPSLAFIAMSSAAEQEYNKSENCNGSKSNTTWLNITSSSMTIGYCGVSAIVKKQSDHCCLSILQVENANSVHTVNSRQQNSRALAA